MLTLNRSALLAALDVCLTSTGDTQSILSHVLVTHVNGTASIHATDFDARVVAQLPAEGDAPILAVHGKSLADALRGIRSESVTIDRLKDGTWVEVEGGSAKFRLPGLPPDDYPEAPSIVGGGTFTIPSRAFAALIGKVDDMVSVDETRPSLNGASMHVCREESEVRIVIVATDGHRLSKAEFLGGDAGDMGAPVDSIVHRKALGTIYKALTASGAADSATVRLARGRIVVTVGSVTIDSRGVDETFPDYTKVMPKSTAMLARVDRAELINAIKAVQPMTSAKTMITKLDVSETEIVLTTANPERGEASCRVGCEHVQDFTKGTTLGANVKYMLQALACLDGASVLVGVSDQFSPIRITSPDDDGTVHVVMPMRI